MKPLLRWAGSKRKNLDTLSAYWRHSAQTKYIEPFAGSACLFFHLEPKKAVIGDLNAELIETYQAIVGSTDRVWEKAVSWTNDRSTYYRIRGLRPRSSINRAARFLYLNRYCFNGIFRTNKAGKFNVPYGGEASGRLPTLAEIHLAAKLLNGARLVSTDFETTLSHAARGDFVYLDPPYRTNSRRVFREYTKNDFQEADLVRLKEILDNLHKTGASFVLSYADCPEAKQLSSGYYCRRIMVRRNVAGFASHRRLAREVIITNMKGPNHEIRS
jgi:DNA adenine methylase